MFYRRQIDFPWLCFLVRVLRDCVRVLYVYFYIRYILFYSVGKHFKVSGFSITNKHTALSVILLGPYHQNDKCRKRRRNKNNTKLIFIRNFCSACDRNNIHIERDIYILCCLLRWLLLLLLLLRSQNCVLRWVGIYICVCVCDVRVYELCDGLACVCCVCIVGCIFRFDNVSSKNRSFLPFVDESHWY